jgi:hypothetical protein
MYVLFVYMALHPVAHKDKKKRVGLGESEED